MARAIEPHADALSAESHAALADDGVVLQFSANCQRGDAARVQISSSVESDARKPVPGWFRRRGRSLAALRPTVRR